MTDASHSIVVICEGPADRRTVCEIADRVLSQSVDWMPPEALDGFREWRGLTKSEPFLAWKKVHALADEANIRIHGHFGGEPGAPDAAVARRALKLLRMKAERGIDAVLLLRDSDNDIRRREGLKQARSETSDLGPIIIGFAHSKRECWVLAGFNATDEDERARLETLRQELGFDPCLQAERLTATQPGAKHDAKRVLGILAEDVQRETQCSMEAQLEQLEARGSRTGLAEFIRELRERLVPLWT